LLCNKTGNALLRNMEARSRNRYCRGKAISSKYYKRVCILALLIRHANRIFLRPFNIVICGLPDYTKFFHISHKRQYFRKERLCVLIFSTTFIRNTSHYKKNSARYCHKCILIFVSSSRYSCQILLTHERFFEKSLTL